MLLVYSFFDLLYWQIAWETLVRIVKMNQDFRVYAGQVCPSNLIRLVARVFHQLKTSLVLQDAAKHLYMRTFWIYSLYFAESPVQQEQYESALLQYASILCIMLFYH